ncbi:MAG: chromosomal replication initiator protein DnaA, partial [Alphaproteobacteria bacterium]
MSLSSAQWTSVQSALKSHLGEEDFNSWISPLRPAETAEAGTVALSVPTRFMQDWIVQNFGAVIQNSVAETLQKPVDIRYVVTPVLAELNTPAKPTAAEKTTEKSSALPDSNHLDSRFRFDNFVTGKSNEFAFAAAKRVAQNCEGQSRDGAYNPFFLHGGVGLGKTHLMNAIAWQIKQQNPNANILYISSEQFLFRFIRALQDKTTMSFKETLRKVDVLMIDDFQFIAGKGATQEEFFHTFNALISAGKQIILTADRSPHEMANVEDRLRSRLGAGLTCEIHAPDLETRMAILNK